ncbi:uncharacterized protein LOC128993084 [Macrosteles quadrilineatus]|uniref:uncharacterized protein LOC128993084 n=1 Tax=Macrosteles quadrilineatus TaxID=74068 RepID=UPI0023E19ADD|nr:uncharacterized protein LOC128993084 [Macrosteles quadrilineatus]
MRRPLYFAPTLLESPRETIGASVEYETQVLSLTYIGRFFILIDPLPSRATMWTITVMLVAVSVTNTAALRPCCEYPGIPKLLAKFADCYKDGKPPVNLVGYDKEVTLKYISKDVLPKNVSCVKGSQQPGKGLVDLFLTDGSQVHLTYKQQVEGNKIVEWGNHLMTFIEVYIIICWLQQM